MKRSILLGLTAIGLLIAYVSLTSPDGSAGSIRSEETVFPENVAQILQLSCYDCHTSASKNIKAKAKLNFDNWIEFTEVKKVGAMDEICSEITKGDMPPGKYLSKHPDRKLTPEQITLVCNWTDEESRKLMGEKEE
ncbi:MAG TPA: heme-binding domain-containing protein [Bacteroidales bacterium]|nr:heme-binding domain-containing protein [Bacteroidales bacterium]HNS47417.1 heme-binding domain-containing protein [Bacteroidales bacterium]